MSSDVSTPLMEWSVVPKATSAELQAAMESLKKLGYAVGQSKTNREGHLIISVGGKMLREGQALSRLDP